LLQLFVFRFCSCLFFVFAVVCFSLLQLFVFRRHPERSEGPLYFVVALLTLSMQITRKATEELQDMS